MSKPCPNKSSESWKKLVKEVGELEAYKVFIANGDTLPSLDEVKKIITSRDPYSEGYILNNLMKLGFINRKPFHGKYYVKTTVGKYPKLINVFKQNIGAISKHNRSKFGDYEVIKIEHTPNGAYVYISLSELNKFKADRSQTTLFANDNETRKRDTKLDNKLTQFIGQYGISVESYNNLKDKLNIDAKGAADILNKLIYISNDKATFSTLPEEVSHFIIDLLPKESQLRTRLLQLASKSNTYENLKKDEFYKSIYKDNEEAYIKEAAGKLLSNSLTNKYLELENKSLRDKINGIWRLISDYIKKLFKRLPIDSIQDIIDLEYGNVAQSILKDNFKDLNIDNLLENNEIPLILYSGDDITTRKIEFFENVKAKINKKIAIYRTKASEAYLSDLNEIKSNLDNLNYELGLTEFIERAHKDISAAAIRLVEFEHNQQDLNIKGLRQLKDYVSAYDELLEEIRDILIEEGGNKDKVSLLADLIAEKNRIKTKYIKHGKKFLSEFLIRYNTNDQITEQQLQSMLDTTESDIGTLALWLDSIGDSPDQILALVSKSVRIEKEKARLEALEASKELANTISTYERNTNSRYTNPDKFFDFMIERDSEKKLTGYFVRQFEPEFYNKKRKFIKILQEAHLGEVEIKVALNKFYAEIGPRYKSKKYEAILKDDNKKQLYEDILKIYKTAQSKLPTYYQYSMLLPQVRKSVISRLYDSNNKVKDLGNYLTSLVERNEQDLNQYGMLTDESGEVLNTIPIYYTGKLSNPSELSLDLVGSIFMYYNMAANYEAMTNIINEVEVANDIIKARKIKQTKGGIPIIDKLLNKQIERDGSGSNAAKMLDEFIKMQVYGQLKSDQGETTIFGFKVDNAKAIDLFGKYVSLNGLALNIFSGISNITVGRVMRIAEAAGGIYYSPKDYVNATILYDTTIFSALSDVGNPNKQSKIELWRELFDISNSSYNNLYSADFSKNRLKQLTGLDSLFFLNTLGEHGLQTKVGLAAAQKWKTKSGKIVNMWDVFEKEGNKLVVKKEFKDIITKDEIIRFAQVVKGINQYLDGIYNTEDKSIIQKGALGRLALMFRKFIVPGFIRRFSGKYYNQRTEEFREGNYVTFYKFMSNIIKDVRKLQIGSQANWNKLEPYEKANIMRTLTELVFLLAATILITILVEYDGDDDEKALQMLSYQTNRLYSELFFYVNPSEFLKIVKSPAAAVSTMTDLVKFSYLVIQPWDWDEEYKRGIKKGDLKILSKFQDLIPLINQLNRLEDIESEISYFN